MKLSTFLLHQLSMFRSFVLFIAVITVFQVVTFSHIFKFLNLYVTSFIVTCYLALSISLLLLFFFLLVISYFPYFKFVTLKTRVILCNTLKKQGRAFQNNGKYILISLAKVRLLINLDSCFDPLQREDPVILLCHARWSSQKFLGLNLSASIIFRWLVTHEEPK